MKIFDGGKTEKGQQDKRIYSQKGVSPTLVMQIRNIPKVLDASGLTTSTDTPAKSTENTMETKNLLKPTSEQSILIPSPTSSFLLQDSHASLLVWLENARGSKTFVEHSFMRSFASLKLKDPSFYSWKTLKACLATTTEKPLEPYWRAWGISDIGLSGKLLTASTLGFPRTGKECSLSDILEPNPADKYFLSEKQTLWLRRKLQESKNRLALVSTATTGREQQNT